MFCRPASPFTLNPVEKGHQEGGDLIHRKFDKLSPIEEFGNGMDWCRRFDFDRVARGTSGGVFDEPAGHRRAIRQTLRRRWSS